MLSDLILTLGRIACRTVQLGQHVCGVWQGVETTSDKEDDGNKDPYKMLDINLDA